MRRRGRQAFCVIELADAFEFPAQARRVHVAKHEEGFVVFGNITRVHPTDHATLMEVLRSFLVSRFEGIWMCPSHLYLILQLCYISRCRGKFLDVVK
jgi:hypothetical protein